MVYNIKTVCRMTGLRRSTLLAWERRYGVVTPRREPNGYRLYSRAEIERLYRLKRLVDQGLRVSEAIRFLAETTPPSEA